MLRLNGYKDKPSATGFPFSFQQEWEMGKIHAIYGPSGSGKSTLLRWVAGLDFPDKGQIHLGNTPFFDTEKNIRIPAGKRDLAYLTQTPPLIPHLTCRENILLVCKQKPDFAFLEELATQGEIADALDRKPGTLSGGQQQRISLIQALINRPQLLLLDEPFTGLDNEIKYALISFLKKLHSQMKFTCLLVSHFKTEIIPLCDSITVLEKGQIVKTESPAQFFYPENTSYKIQLEGMILDILPSGLLSLIRIALPDQIIRIALPSDEVARHRYEIGKKIRLGCKAFDPVPLDGISAI